MIGNNKMNTKIHFIFFVLIQLSCFAQSSAISENLMFTSTESIATTQRNLNGPLPPTANAQALCQGSAVSNLVANGTALQWYNVPSGGATLASNTLLVTGNYYVSQTVGGLESTRTQVAVTINFTDAPTSTSQTLNSGSTIGSLTATGTSLLWYNTLTGGIALSSFTQVTAGTYYVSQTLNGCESTRTSVVISILFPPSISYASSQIYTVGVLISPLSPTNNGGVVPANYINVSTLAGSGSNGFANGTGTAASFSYPFGIAIDGSGNLYVAEQNNNRIRKITPTGVVSTYAGTGVAGYINGTASAATFSNPSGVAVDAIGNVFVADFANHKIRKITPDGIVSTFAGSTTNLSGSVDGTGTSARFNNPTGIAVDASGNVFVADRVNNKIRKITPDGVVTTLAGSGNAGSTDGIGTVATFQTPSGVTVDGSGNIYVAEYNINNPTTSNKIRKITPDGVVSTLAGSGTAGSTDGIGTAASFNKPFGVAVDASGTVFVAERVNNLIRKISASGEVTVFAGNGSAGSIDGNGSIASFREPSGVVIDGTGNLFVVEISNHKVRKITSKGYSITPSLPEGLIFDGATGTISGAATVASPTKVYTITATNQAGSSSTTINITCNPDAAIWSGSWSTTPAANKYLIFNASYNTPGDIAGLSCTINSGNVTIPSGSTLSLLDGIIINGGTLTFENNASLLQTNSIANTANITYKRNTSILQHNYDFVYWGSPVSNQALGNIWMASTWPDTFYGFDTAANNWTFNYATTIMTPGIGYISRARNGQDGFAIGTTWTASFIGVPNNGNKTVSIVKSGTNINNLLANPYPSAIDLEAFYEDNHSVITPNFYFWTHNTSVSGTLYTASDYATYNALLGAGIGTGFSAAAGGNAPDRYVDAGQGFFVEGYNTGGTATFKNTQRVAGNNNAFYKLHSNSIQSSALESHKLWLNLYSNEGLFKQQLLTYTENATNNFDPNLDAVTFDSNDFMDFYSIIPENQLVIQSRTLPFSNQDVVALGFKTNVAGKYSIDIDHFDGLFADQTVFLRDNLLNNIHNLSEEAYTFTTETGAFNHRFEILYTDTVLSNTTFELENDIVMYVKDHVLHIISSHNNLSSVAIKDVQGRNIYANNSIDSKQIAINNLKVSTQIVLVTVTNDKGQKITKKVGL
jgi:sugar lactone lactonase YvrE